MNILSKKLNIFQQGALFSAVFLLLLLLSIFIAPSAKAGPNSPAAFNDADGTECAWIADSYIICGEGQFWFDYDLSVAKGKAIYHYRTQSNGSWDWAGAYLIFESDGESGQIVNSPDVSDDGTAAFISDRNKRTRRMYAENNDPNSPEWTDKNTGNAYQEGGDTGKEYYFCGIQSQEGDECWSGVGGVKNTVTAEGAALLSKISEDITSTVESEEECTEDAGSLGFVLCPILDTTRGAVKALIGDGSGKGFLVELLTIRPLSTTSTPELYSGWQVIRNIALGLYILIFVLIIFGNGIGYDPYTIKRALPRLAAGVVLTFASWWIMQTLVDASNVAGNVIPALVSRMSGEAGISNYAIDLNPALGFGSIILLIVVALIALGALLIGVAGLVMRVVIIYGLVLLAPLAFLAWVLPNTESIFKKWWQNLVRVLMMFPIVTGMLALSLFFQQIMLRTQTTAAGDTGSVGGSYSNSTAGIVGMLAPLIAIILIPKTFKWGGAMFAAAAGYMAAKATQGKDWGKKSALESSKSGRVGQALNKMAENPVLGRVPGVGGITQRQRYANIAKRQASFDKKMSDGLDKVSDPNLKKLWATQSYYDPQSGQRKAKNTPYAKAGEKEMNARRGKKLADIASAYRDGRYADAGRAVKGLRELDAYMGVNPSTTEDRVGNIFDRVNQTIGSTPNQTEMAMAMGAELNDDGTVKYENGTPVFKEVDQPSSRRRIRDVAKQSWQNRAANRGQGGYINPSAFRGSSSSNGPTGTGGGGPSGSPGGAGPGPGPVGTGSGSPGGGTGTAPHIPTSPPPPPGGGAPTYSTPTGAPRYTTGGVPIPPPPSGGSSGATPPPYRGPSPAWQPAPGSQTPPPTPGGGGALPPTPSSGGTGSGGATVINNVTNEVNNNVTNNVSTSRNANQASPVGSIGGPTTIPSGALGDLSRQIGRMMSRTGSSAGLASLESKISTLQDMIAREGRNSNNVKNLLRTMREEAGSLPSHEQGAAEDALNNFEHQSGINGPDSSDGAAPGDI